jgi:hypothetical protein
METYLLRGLLELIMPTLLRMEVRKRRIAKYFPTFGALDALINSNQVSH